MNIAANRNIGAFFKALYQKSATTVDSEADGTWQSRKGYLSGKLVLSYAATLGEDETLTVAANLQDATASDGTGAADYGTALAAAVVATGGAGGSTEVGVLELDVDLSAADEYVRSQQTFTTSSTGTCIWSAVLLVGGAAELPVA